MLVAELAEVRRSACKSFQKLMEVLAEVLAKGSEIKDLAISGLRKN